MISFTHQEKIAVVFLAASVFVGSLFLLLEKRHPAVFSILMSDSSQKIFRKINIHTASLEDWESLPGIGPYRASMILEAREARGGFRSIDDVRYVKGIGPKVFNQIRERLTDE